jgi:hypothetical protein
MKLLTSTSAAAIGLGMALAIAPTWAWAETRVHGTPQAVVVEAQNATVEEILVALTDTFKVEFRSAANLDKRITGTYQGTLQQAVSHILKGYDFVVKSGQAGLEITLLDGRKKPVAVVGTRPASKSADADNHLVPVTSSSGPTPPITVAQGSGPVPVTSSGGPMPPFKVAQGPSPVPTRPADGAGPVPTPQTGPSAASSPMPMPPPPGAAPGPVPPLPTAASAGSQPPTGTSSPVAPPAPASAAPPAGTAPTPSPAR